MALQDNPRGLLVHRDELSGWLASFDMYRATRGADAARWNELYHGRPLIVDRKTGTPRTIRVDMAAVSVTGTTQPGTLRRLLTPELFESGLAARVLFAAPPYIPTGGRPRDIPGPVSLRYQRIVERLCYLAMEVNEERGSVPVDLPMTPEAEGLWWRWVREWTEERRDLDEESALQAVGAKLEATAARLALLLSLASWADGRALAPGPVGLESMEGGITLTRWFMREATRLYSVLLEGTDLPPRLLALVRWIQRRGGDASPRDVARSGPAAYRAPGGSERAEKDLQALVDAGILEPGSSPETDGAGRPAPPRYALRPLRHATECANSAEKLELCRMSHGQSGDIEAEPPTDASADEWEDALP